MNDETDHTPRVGDRVVLDHVRLTPKYLKGAICVVTDVGTKTYWGGAFAQDPYFSYDLKIERMKAGGPTGYRRRYKEGTQLVNVDERLVTKVMD